MSEAKEPPAPEAAAAPSGGKKKLVMYGTAAVLLIGIVGGGAYWWTAGAAPAEGQPAEEEEVERGIVKLEPFVVNLADVGTSRYLRLSLELLVKDPHEAEELEKSRVALTQARSAILELLTTQTSSDLVTPEGKTALREAIKQRVGHAWKHMEIVDVLFTDFVVQF